MLAAMPTSRPPVTRLAALLMALPVLAGLAGLEGCAAGSDPPRHAAGPGRAATAGRATGGLAGLRAGLTRRTGGPAYYLSLGDSLARGIQPGPTGQDVATSDGYPNLLAARLRGVIGRVRLVQLGCSGETTSTMIHGGICRYPAGSQLAQAARFLRAHRGQVALVTIDIGANDANSCVLGQPRAAIIGCLYQRVGQLQANLSAILGQLRSAGGPRVLIVGMTYYVPELGLWHAGRTGKKIAAVTYDFAAGANKLLAARYRRYGARVADVFGAFRSSDFAMAKPTGLARPPGGRDPRRRTAVAPVNVTVICSLTWMCARPPRGPNEHANDAGYRVIAEAFWRAITR